MKRFDVHIGSPNRALEQTPEVLKAINVDVAFSVRNGMVNNLMHVFIGQSVVAAKFVGDYLRAFFNVCANRGVKIARANSLHNFAANARRFIDCFTLRKSKNSSFSDHARLTSPFALVHESSLCTDVSFVGLNAARKLLDRTILQCKPDAVTQEPCAFLRDSKRAMQLVRTDSVFGACNQPHCAKPFVNSNGAIFHDRANLD